MGCNTDDGIAELTKRWSFNTYPCGKLWRESSVACRSCLTEKLHLGVRETAFAPFESQARFLPPPDFVQHKVERSRDSPAFSQHPNSAVLPRAFAEAINQLTEILSFHRVSLQHFPRADHLRRSLRPFSTLRLSPERPSMSIHSKLSEISGTVG